MGKKGIQKVLKICTSAPSSDIIKSNLIFAKKIHFSLGTCTYNLICYIGPLLSSENKHMWKDRGKFCEKCPNRQCAKDKTFCSKFECYVLKLRSQSI